MVVTVTDLIVRLHRDATLLTGTSISPSTPAGVNSTRQPLVCLAASDGVSIEIEGIGRLISPVQVA